MFKKRQKSIKKLNRFATRAIVENICKEAMEDLEGPGEDYHEKSWRKVSIELPVVIVSIVECKDDASHEI